MRYRFGRIRDPRKLIQVIAYRRKLKYEVAGYRVALGASNHGACARAAQAKLADIFAEIGARPGRPPGRPLVPVSPVRWASAASAAKRCAARLHPTWHNAP